MPQEEIDLLASPVSWKPARELEHPDHPSQDGGSSVRDVDSIGKLWYSGDCHKLNNALKFRF